MVTRVTPVTTVEPTSLNFNAQTTATTSFVISDLGDYSVSICLGVITLAVTSILLLLIYQRHTRTLVLECTTGPECVTVPVLYLSLCSFYWDVQLPFTVEHIRVSGYFFPTLTVDWPAFSTC